MANVAQLVVGMSANLDKLNSGVDRGINKVKNAGAKMGGFGKKVLGGALVAGAGAAAAGIGALVVGVGALGVASFDVATQVQQSQATIQAALGESADRAEELSKVAQNVFADGLAGSVGEATDAIVTARQQLGDLADSELQAATSSALKFAKTYDQDVGESLSAVRTLTDEFGLSNAEAFDFLAAGMQKGLNASDDFLDSVGEYSNLFAQGGADAGQFFSLLESGLAGGVLGTDKAADAYKEFGIRFIEANDGMIEGLTTLGVDYEALRAQVDSGAISMTDAFGQVVNKIAESDTSLLANQEAVAKLGTQFEDMGIDAVAALSVTKTGMDDVAGASDALNANFETVGARMESLKNRAMIALAPLGDILLSGFEAAFPALEAIIMWFTTTALPVIVHFATMAQQWISNFITQATPIVEAFAEKWQATVAPAMLLVQDAITRISAALEPLMGEFSLTDALLDDLKQTLDIVIIALQAFALVAQGVASGIQLISKSIQKMTSWVGIAGDKLSGLKSKIPDWLIPGSPPPLYHAINDIKDALGALPSFDDAFSFPEEQAAAPLLGGDSGNNDIGIGGNGPITININNPKDAEQAKIGVLDGLRAVGLA